MRLVELMTNNPPTCLHCGRGNVEESDGEIPKAVDLERDVGWGDSTYICELCGAIIASLLGFLDPEAVKELERTVKAQKKVIHDLKALLAQKKRRMEAIVAGDKARKKERVA